ncbi:MAG: CapA family protein [Calditrichaeota bacterium]|nr:CapA family protein [Calditrichota bacterium]
MNLNTLISLTFLVSPLFAKVDSTSIQLYFTGDVTLSNHFERHVKDSTGYAFKKLKWFSEADISMINLENPLTARGKKVEKAFNFRAKPNYAKILVDGGIDIVTIANNHIYDYGAEGLHDTILKLVENNIQYVGAGRNIYEAQHPVIFYIKGKKIAYYAFYGTHKHSDSYPATEDSAGTAMRRLNIIKESIGRFRSQVDFVIVNFHWGREKAEYPGKDQIQFAHTVIGYGADIIVGHHPHVLQGIEKYKGKIIAYSLGNFIFGGNSRKSYKTAILEINISGNDVEASIIPIQVNYWQPFRLEGAEAKSVLNLVEKLSENFDESIFEKE